MQKSWRRSTVVSLPWILLALSVNLGGQAAPQMEARHRAEFLLKQMTLEEKVGQLNQIAGIVIPGLRGEKPDALIAEGKVGSVLWLNDSKEINRLQHVALEKSRLHIPLLFGFDVIHGYRTVFPVPLAMASSWDPEMEEAAQRLVAQDARAAGIDWTFAPMVDTARDGRWGRIVEGAGEDPYLGAAMARTQVLGFQGDALGPESILACAKHFAGYGAAEGGRDYDSSYIPEELLRNVYLVPFKAAADAGVGSFMSAYMDLNDVPAAGNSWLLTDILRKEWGFQGFVVSDAFAVRDLVTHGYASDAKDAADKAIHAGLNMDMASQTYINNLPNLVANRKVTETQLNAMVLPILQTKYALGLFDHPYVDESKVDEVLNRPEELKLERQVAGRSMVLLKNENHTLPLSKDLNKIAVIGPLADSAHDIEGPWTVEGGLFGGPIKSHPVTIFAGLKAKVASSAGVVYVAGPPLGRLYAAPFDAMMGTKALPPVTPEEVRDWISRSKAAADHADVVIAVLGESVTMSGEAASRATLDLPGIQEQMLETVVATGKPTILVLEAGRPLDIRWAAEHVPAILEAWYPGTEGGNAVADVLFGDVNPGGKLPVTWPRVAGQEPLYYNHNLTHEPEDRPDFTSRYWDLSSKPLYPFGYGLSYTTFQFSNLRLTKNKIKAGDATEVYVDVTNTGEVPGDTVAQIYIHQRAGTASRPVRQLKGFRRMTLEPGQTKTLSFALGKDELRFWSPQTRMWAVEPCTFDVWAGEDSTAGLHAELVVTN
jgi:beta-glucosidase